MKHSPLSTQDQELIHAAKETLKRLYRKGWHGVASAIRTKQGKVYTAIHLEATIGRIAVCGEAITLGKAISEGEKEFETIVAVWYPNDGEVMKVAVSELLPNRCDHEYNR